jgi:hypothetical protein
MKLLELWVGKSFQNESEESALLPCEGGRYALMRRRSDLLRTLNASPNICTVKTSTLVSNTTWTVST